MQVRKFEAPTIQEALDHVKRELGPEAIILQTSKKKRGFGLMAKPSIEITAAVSDRSLGKKKAFEVRIPEASKEIVKKYSAEKQAEVFDKFAERQVAQAAQMKDQVNVGDKTKKMTTTRYIDIEKAPEPQKAPILEKPSAPIKPTFPHFEEELKNLKQMIQELQVAQEQLGHQSQVLKGQGSPTATASISLDRPLIQDAFEHLVVNGVDRRYALSLVKKVAFELNDDDEGSEEKIADLLANEIMDTLEVLSPLTYLKKDAQTDSARSKAKLIALVGPTGVGKTTTIAKLASDAIRRGLKVGLINLDSQKIGAFEQLSTYAKILKIPFRSAGTEDDLRAALSDYYSLDLVLLDTSGCSQKNPESIHKANKLFQQIGDVHSYLVLSATTRDTELYEIAGKFSVFHPEGLVISKLDEASVYGSIYNVFQKSKLPLLYFTTGQKVPDDLEEATKERVASLVMEI